MKKVLFIAVFGAIAAVVIAYLLSKRKNQVVNKAQEQTSPVKPIRVIPPEEKEVVPQVVLQSVNQDMARPQEDEDEGERFINLTKEVEKLIRTTGAITLS